MPRCSRRNVRVYKTWASIFATAADHPGTDFSIAIFIVAILPIQRSMDTVPPAHHMNASSGARLTRMSTSFQKSAGQYSQGATTWLAGSHHLLPPARIQKFSRWSRLVVDDTVPPAHHIDARLLRRRQVFRCESFKPILARSHKALCKVVFRTRHPQGEQSGHV